MTDTVRIRREPPAFRHASVLRLRPLTPHMRRVTLSGPDLEGFSVEEPAASVRVLLPPAGRAGLVIPTWNGNEFLMPDGTRPILRTFTPRYWRADELELDVDIVLHPAGAASAWVVDATPGSPVAISGPGRGYEFPSEAAFWLAGDESAIPAIAQLLEVLPATPVEVHVEVTHPDARMVLPEHPTAAVTWHDLPAGSDPGTTLFAALENAELPEDVRVWAAGNAAAMHRIRRHLFDVCNLDRSQATVRGYWKKR
jgi:NADPH-dependent ferric siderophore reductase